MFCKQKVENLRHSIRLQIRDVRQGSKRRKRAYRPEGHARSLSAILSQTFLSVRARNAFHQIHRRPIGDEGRTTISNSILFNRLNSPGEVTPTK